MDKANIIYKRSQCSLRDDIEDVVENYYFVDYGIISKMNGSKSCDVIHAIRKMTYSGECLEDTVTKDVEVLWPASEQFSLKFTLSKGDRVLLLGTKNYLSTVDITEAKNQDVYASYTQGTMKAIPLCVFNANSKVTVSVDGGDLSVKVNEGDASLDMGPSGMLELKNSLQSLKSLVDELFTNLTTMSSTPAVSGSPIYAGGAAQWPALKAKYDLLFK